MKTFKNANGNPVLMKMVKAIHENKDYLGEVDGLIGDGDHGMNMNKGFMMFGDEFGDQKFTFADGLDNLGNILFSKIGDSMGPIYGTIFMDAAEQGIDFPQALEDMKAAAKKGMESTKDMVAKFGRSSRLGERSRGVLDAGSVSCCIILTAMADGILENL